MGRRGLKSGHVSKTPCWDGYADTLSGRISKTDNGSYAKGVYLATRHLEQFHSSDHLGRPYSEAQADGMRAEAKNQKALFRRVEAIDLEIVLVKQDIDNLGYITKNRDFFPVSASINLYKMIAALHKQIRSLEADKKFLVKAINSPCAKCEAWAMCAVMSFACSNFVEWVNKPKATYFQGKQPPSVEEFAKLQVEN